MRFSIFKLWIKRTELHFVTDIGVSLLLAVGHWILSETAGLWDAFGFGVAIIATITILRILGLSILVFSCYKKHPVAIRHYHSIIKTGEFAK